MNKSITVILLVLAQVSMFSAQAVEQPKIPAPATPAVAAPVAHKLVRRLSNRRGLDSLAAFANARKFKLTKYGAGPVRLWVIGNAAVPEPEKLVLDGEQVLQGLEVWTGKQGLFTPTGDDRSLYMVYFARNQDFDAWVDQARKEKVLGKTSEGEDLTKKAHNTWLDRVGVAGVRLPPIMRHHFVYSICCLAVDTFYYERGGDSWNNCWLREGLAAEMQRLICDGQVHCYTFTYENSSTDLKDDWAKTMSEMIVKGDKKAKIVRPANEIMVFDLIKIPSANYIQMWSLCTYVRVLGGSKKGPDNLFAKLLLATAAGTASERAVEANYGIEDPKLSQAWAAWAAAYRSDPTGSRR